MPLCHCYLQLHLGTNFFFDAADLDNYVGQLEKKTIKTVENQADDGYTIGYSNGNGSKECQGE